MNLNYRGSVAEEDMRFASSTGVEDTVNNELFNTISLYVPLPLADRNIVDFDPSWVTAEVPAVITCVAENYAAYMKGPLLDQWAAAFNQGSNLSLVVHLIVFKDDASTAGDWEIDDVSIRFKPLSRAFEMLYFVSYVKLMFDEDNDGSPVRTGTIPGTVGTITVQAVHSSSGTTVTVQPGSYVYNDGQRDWVLSVSSTIQITQNNPVNLTFTAATTGPTSLTVGTVLPNATFPPGFPGLSYCAYTVQAVTQGTDPTPVMAPSMYFDRSLALAYLCKTDPKLSQFWSLVRLRLSNAGFPALEGRTDPNACWIRSKTAAEEKAYAGAGLTVAGDGATPNPRSQYYWGFLWQMGCLDNTWVVAHSEPLNILTEVLAAWFSQKNSSGQYIGNKLSLLRLTGAKIKPLGFPSLLNSDVNENDVGGHAILNAKNVGYLKTISDNTAQQSCMSSAMSLGGIPVTAMMIGAFINYESAQECANMITATGTLIDPALTDEDAYKRIQAIVISKLGLFASTNGRLYDVELKFPSFQEAKTGRTQLEAASAWAAVYKDDLAKVAVSGGITAR